eukprot:TRINITY_DN1116_c0_g1_i1.p1 TRINITY_DN1116_c0_g1~~TRINITY_DN1116_c0_g1_i1.p1  ORF type:complete len:450 (+),score=171.85 TRINITY_DN1116_c0_g1_i1:73-1350(+)
MAAANFGKLSIDDVQLAGKRVVMRVDFNVPIKGGKVTNDLRIRGALKTIRKVVDSGASLVLISHLGRPQKDKKKDPEGWKQKTTLRPVATRLQELLERPIQFAPDCTQAGEQAKALRPGEVLLLENVRHSPDEDAKKPADRERLAKILASYGDIYCSDAFGTAHRDSASMTGVPHVKGSGCCGYLMKKEIDYFAGAMRNPAKPFVAIVGGAKVSDKILLLGSLLRLSDKMIICGAMAYTFLKCLGHNTGKSKVEVRSESRTTGEVIDVIAHASDIMRAARVLGVKIILPVDHRCAREFKDVEPHVTVGQDVPDGMMALDIGPKSEELFKHEIRECRTAIWNGPAGVFEMENFKSGTFAIAKALAKTSGMLSIVGGGDTGAAAEKSGWADKLSHISTGGGASLELMEGKVLPGLSALTDAVAQAKL